MGVALLLPALGAAATPLDCTQGLLQRLGWHFETRAIGAPQVHGGPVCTRASLPEAQAAGDLRVQWPADMPAAAPQMSMMRRSRASR